MNSRESARRDVESSWEARLKWKRKWDGINDPALDEIVDVNMDGDGYANRDDETEQEELKASYEQAEQFEARRAQRQGAARGPEKV